MDKRLYLLEQEKYTLKQSIEQLENETDGYEQWCELTTRLGKVELKISKIYAGDCIRRMLRKVV